MTAAEPQEDELGGSRLAWFSGALAMCSLLLASASSSLLLASTSSSLLASTSGLLVEELLAAGSLLLASTSSSLLLASASSSLLAGMSSLRVEELLAAGILLLVSTSGLFLGETEAMVLVRPQFVDGPLPIPVCAVCARASAKKNGPPEWRRRQHSGSLFVFADGSLKPIFFAMRSTKGVRGGGCSVCSSRTTTRGRVGEAATI